MSRLLYPKEAREPLGYHDDLFKYVMQVPNIDIKKKNLKTEF